MVVWLWHGYEMVMAWPKVSPFHSALLSLRPGHVLSSATDEDPGPFFVLTEDFSAHS